MGVSTNGERLLMNLIGQIAESDMRYLSKEKAYSMLRDLTGMDFGFDAKKYWDWMKENSNEIISMERPE